MWPLLPAPVLKNEIQKKINADSEFTPLAKYLEHFCHLRIQNSDLIFRRIINQDKFFWAHAAKTLPIENCVPQKTIMLILST